MAGALDDTPVGMLDPRSMALMQMGLGLMQSSGPSLMPHSLGQSLGQAGMQGMQAFQQQSMLNQKLAEAQRIAQARAEQESAQNALLSRPEFAGVAPLVRAGVPLGSVLPHVMPKPKDPNELFAKVDPKDYTPESVSRFRQTMNYGDLVKASEVKAPPTRKVRIGNEEVAQEFVNGEWKEVGRGAAFSDRPIVNVDNRQPTKFNEEVGQELGKQYAGLMKADFSAPATIGKYQQLGTLLGQVNTGKFAGTTADIKATAKGLGIDLASMGVRDDVAPAQAAKALSNQLALELRNPAGGAGMPGAMSDQDRQFLIQMVPNLENDPGAIGKMIDYRTRLAKREQQVAKMARAYRKKNGNFDEGFFDELQEWSNKNPIFGDEKLPAAPARVRRFNPATGRIED